MLQCGPHSYEWVITTHADSYYIYVILPNKPSTKGATVYSSFNLKILMGTSSDVQKILDDSSSVEDFKSKLGTEINSLAAQESKCPQAHSPKFYKTIFNELNQILPFPEISADLHEIKLRITDAASREHCAVVCLPQSYPDGGISILCHDLPVSANTSRTPNFNDIKSLEEFYTRFRELIEFFQPFWNSVEILDSSCWILEPQQPKFADVFRRVKIAEYCSLNLTFDPYKPLQRPNIEFRGMQDDVDRLRNSLEKNLLDDRWDPDVDVHLNLLTALDLEGFPIKDIPSGNNYNLVQPGECGICFEEKLDDQSADIRCDNPRCESQFHQKCLLRYLSSNLNNMRMKNAVFGNCPTCRESIGCPLNSESNELLLL